MIIISSYKDIFLDLKSNKNGSYLKISERRQSNRNSIFVPASGLNRLSECLLEILDATSSKPQSNQKSTRYVYSIFMSYKCQSHT